MIKYETFERWKDQLESINGEQMTAKVSQQFRKTWEKGEAAGMTQANIELMPLIEESTTVIKAQGQLIDQKDRQIESLMKALQVARDVFDLKGCTHQEMMDFCEGGETMDAILEARKGQKTPGSDT